MAVFCSWSAFLCLEEEYVSHTDKDLFDLCFDSQRPYFVVSRFIYMRVRSSRPRVSQPFLGSFFLRSLAENRLSSPQEINLSRWHGLMGTWDGWVFSGRLAAGEIGWSWCFEFWGQ